MDVRSIGAVMPLEDVGPGQCILFQVNNATAVGMTISLGPQARGILHFAATRDGWPSPHIYNLDHFINEACIVIESARIVPVLAPEHTGFGRYEGKRVSPALYITDKAILLLAVNGHSIVPINLLTGTTEPLSTSMAAYTTAWYIEVINADGSFEPFCEFRCEPEP